MPASRSQAPTWLSFIDCYNSHKHTLVLPRCGSNCDCIRQWRSRSVYVHKRNPQETSSGVDYCLQPQACHFLASSWRAQRHGHSRIASSWLTRWLVGSHRPQEHGCLPCQPHMLILVHPTRGADTGGRLRHAAPSPAEVVPQIVCLRLCPGVPPPCTYHFDMCVAQAGTMLFSSKTISSTLSHGCKDGLVIPSMGCPAQRSLPPHHLRWR
mmetsp:Transcript_41526/g.124096  ORF Transcript_41526/g.124096 Transcript_41526/m.124096 type:complete len:210 (-) Transcript_41526:346-975(-)